MITVVFGPVQTRQRDFVFSWDKMLAMEGNTAPYLMYAYARIRSIYRKGADQAGKPKRAGKLEQAGKPQGAGKPAGGQVVLAEPPASSKRPGVVEAS